MNTISTKSKMKIHNKFEFEVVDCITGKVKQNAVAYNVICNQLWSALASGDSYATYIHIGSGSGTPSMADTALFHFESYKIIPNNDSAANKTDIDYSEHTAWARYKVTLSETELVGTNITEIGLAKSYVNSGLCTHAMLQDMNGNQISIQKTNTDIINIYATVYVHWSDFSNGAVFFPYSWLGGPHSYNACTLLNWLFGSCSLGSVVYAASLNTGTNPICGYMYGATNWGQSSLDRSFNATTKKLTLTMGRIPAQNANIGGINSIGIGPFSYPTNTNLNYVAPNIYFPANKSWNTGSDIVGEAVGTGDGVTTDFKTTFPFPTNAIVYVDGVATPCTVENKPNSLTNMGKWFEFVDMGSSGDFTNYVSFVNAIPPSVCEPDYIYGYRYGSCMQIVYFNPHYELGIVSYKTFGDQGVFIDASDDLTNWDRVSDTSINGTTSVPSACQHKKYWRITSPNEEYGTLRGITNMQAIDTDENNVHFSTPPAQGAVITANYHTTTIVKDENHVFDFNVDIQLGEYTDE